MSTIITHKQFNNHIYRTEIAGRPFSLEFGKVAELANASAMVRYGDTSVLVAVTASPRPRDGIDFFPLSVDFEEKLYAVGRIPGSFLRREGQPSLPAVLASRVIDRSISPLFPGDFRSGAWTGTALPRPPPWWACLPAWPCPTSPGAAPSAAWRWATWTAKSS